jgi:multicomponent Na+:H+ antiporter subunit A
MAAALLLGVVGYAVSGIYIVFGAPDLALTQLLIETLTIALFALVLAKLPRRFGADPRSLSRSIRIGVSVLVGVVIAGAAALANTGSPDRTVAEAYIELAPEAGGRNVVNIILTNFRALDTLGEITVLAAAAVGIAALVGARSRNQDREDAR